MNQERISETVLAIHPTARGLGFVVMRSPLSPIDWGTRDVRGGQLNAQCIEKISKLIEAHQPDALILEDPTAPGSGRSARIRRLVRAVATLANGQALDVHVYPRSRVRQCFETVGARTRYEIAVVIAKRVTAFDRFLPPPRRAWMSEDARLSIFNAAALAMTFFSTMAE